MRWIHAGVFAVAIWLAWLSTMGAGTSLADTCPNEALRYGYGAHLPDCRAYEQATPVEKDGTNPEISYDSVQAAANGDGITFFSESGAPGALGAQATPVFLSMRKGEEWATQGLLPPAADAQVANVAGWTPDLTEAFSFGTKLGEGVTFLAKNDIDGSMSTMLPPTQGPERFNLLGTSANGADVFLEVDRATLTPEAAPEKHNVYAWDRETGVLSLVGVLPQADCESSSPCAPAGGSFGGAYDWWFGETEVDNIGAFAEDEHVVSTDGQRAYFTAGGTGQVYLREDPTGPNARTLQVSASQKTNGSGADGSDPYGPQPAAFATATPDGSMAFFMSSAELTNNANTGTEDQGRDLYRYDAATRALTDLTPDPTGNGAEVQGVVGVSEDGSYVYFVANADLDGAGGATTGDCAFGGDNEGGECSLYVWHEGTTRFIARLDRTGSVAGASDAADWVPHGEGGGGGQVFNTAHVDAEGTVVLFRSQRRLTGYESRGVAEFYRYDATTEELTCVTCNPSGAPPVASPSLQSKTSFFGNSGPAAVETRNFSASGDQFFFETGESLLASDVNKTTDVYEWEADGAGSCKSTSDGGGCLYLISTGTSPDPSHFGDASVSGDDVFFFTGQQLVGQDQDQLVDVYDARIDGGLTSQVAQPTGGCSGEACKGTVPAVPVFSAPGSSTFSGTGNAEAMATASVLTRNASGAKFDVSVRTTAEGGIVLSAAGIGRVSATSYGPGVYRLPVGLTAKARSELERHGSLTLSLKLTYSPAGGAVSSRTGELSVRVAGRAKPGPRKPHRPFKRHRGGAK